MGSEKGKMGYLVRKKVRLVRQRTTQMFAHVPCFMLEHNSPPFVEKKAVQ